MCARLTHRNDKMADPRQPRSLSCIAEAMNFALLQAGSMGSFAVGVVGGEWLPMRKARDVDLF